MSRENYASYFRVLDLASQGNEALFVLIEGYIDESGTNEADKAICVAGYLMRPDHGIRMSEKWVSVLAKYDLPFFHMTDCAHYQVSEPYKSLGKDKCIALATELIELIKRHCLIGVSVCFSPLKYRMYDGDPRYTKSHYQFAITILVARLWGIQHDKSCKNDFALILEAGHKHSGQARVALDLIIEERLSAYGAVSYAFLQKEKAPLLQAADILAWHSQMHIKRVLRGQPIRKDFASLTLIPHEMIHIKNYDHENPLGASTGLGTETVMKLCPNPRNNDAETAKFIHETYNLD